MFPWFSNDFHIISAFFEVFLGFFPKTSSTAAVPGTVLLFRLAVFLGRRLIDLQQDLQCSADDGGVDDNLAN